MKEQIKALVAEKINASLGIRYTELAAEVWHDLFNNENPPEDVSTDDFHSIVAEMLKTGEITGIEYEVPLMEYRTKQILFPKGTHLRVATTH